MSSKTEIQVWSAGVDAFELGDLEGAIDAWKEIADYSKIHFNLAIVFMSDQYWDDAIDALSRAIACDSFMAIAYYARGYCHFVVQEYEQAHNDFSTGLEKMRGNDSVDYTQLGLCFKLFSCEFYFNRALCLFALGSSGEANSDLKSAKSCKSDGAINDHGLIDEAISLQQDACSNLEPFMLPLNLVYKPSEYKTKNAEKVDYLGKSKVVASADSDTYNGFSGTLIRKQSMKDNGAAATPKKPEPSPIKRSQTVALSRMPARAATLGRSQSADAGLPPIRPRKGSVGSLNFKRDDDSGVSIPQRKMSMTSGRSPILQSRSPSQPRKNSIDRLSEQSTESSVATDKIKIKCHFEGQTRMVLASFDVEFSHLEGKLCKKFGVNDIDMRYRDEDGELVSITDQEDLVFAMSCFGIEWGDFGSLNKMELFCN